MIKRIESILCSISNDKVLHFILSMIVCQISFCLFCLFTPLWLATILSFLCVCMIGAFKELYDKTHGGVSSWKDFAADVFGGVTGVLISLCICFSVL